MIRPPRPHYWEFTLEGRNCHCNSCHTQFYSKEAFADHYQRCPVRIRLGYIPEFIVSPS